MDCTELAALVEKLQPDATPQDVARLCLVLLNSCEEPKTLRDAEVLRQALQDANLRLEAATDQHAAMTLELEELANSDPTQFSPDQVWVLVRAIKVQSQIVGMYRGEPALDI